jgi:ornithine carbamoyltransferase
MGTAVRHSLLAASAGFSPAEAEALLASARALQRAAAAGQPQALLRGKNLGLLCPDDSQQDALLFRRAAAELGAHVAHIGMSLSERSDAQEVAHTARLLGRLYDAVECQGLAHEVVQQIAGAAGIAVYDALASPQHPSAQLAEQLGGPTSPAENRRFVLQALLLSTIC